ncbi:MAG TPA: serine/threonine-protein kinase, partial [Phycisphaerae bacterium]|nr:serine/threonine-protein kinase [Phycisphaerae bacterium]
MQGCPTHDEIRRFASGHAAPEDASRVARHLRDCPNCRSLLAAGTTDATVPLASTLAETVVQSPAADEATEETRILDDPSATAQTADSAETVATAGKSTLDWTEPATVPLAGKSPTGPAPGAWSLDAGASGATPDRNYLPSIAGYEIQRIVGRGGMGVVYEAVQLKLRRRVALKLLPAVVGSQHPDLVARFQREATAAARLHHSNIIPIYDYGESRDGYYYAMELIHGESLGSVIRRLAAFDTPLTARTSVSLSLGSDVVPPDAAAPQPIERQIVSLGSGGVPYYRQVAEWVASIADALDYAHQHGMIHRDIKPGNIMLAADGRVIILDFGLVKMDDDVSVTASGSTVGTFRYISPEQIACRDKLDGRCDQYALGVTFYELLVLRPAFPELDQRAVLDAVLHREPTAPRRIAPSIPRELEVVCRKAMEKSAKDRYASCAAMAADLRRFLADVPIQARPAGPVRRAVKFVKRHRAASLTTLTALLLATSIAFGAWQREKAHRLRLDALLREAVAAWQQRDWNSAEDKFQQVLAADPHDFRALVNFAATRKDEYFADPRPELLAEAAALLDRALRDQPTRPEIWNFRGVVLREQGKLSEALAAHEKAAELAPDHDVTWINLATVRAMLGDLEKAEEEMRKGIHLGAGKWGPKAWYNLAAVQLELDRPEALASTLQAIDHPPEKVDDLWRPAPYLLRTRLYLNRAHQSPGRKPGDKLDDRHTDANQPNDAVSGITPAPRTPPDEPAADLRAAVRSAIVADELCAPIARRKPANLLERLVLARAKRNLALAELRAQHWTEALSAAEAARAYADLPSAADLIAAIARAHLGEPDVAKIHYARALANWPPALRESPYTVRADGGMLWFENAA